MQYKKTFWMNVVFTTLAILLAIAAFCLHVSEHGLEHLPVFIFGFSCIIAIPLTTAIALKQYNSVKLRLSAQALNCLVLMYVLYQLIYSTTGNLSMDKKVMQAVLFVYFFILVIPSLINLKALSKSPTLQKLLSNKVLFLVSLSVFLVIVYALVVSSF